MYHNHPYSGWGESGQGYSSAWPQNPPPSILGALPYPNVSSAPSIAIYRIVNFSPDVLNAQVVDPRGQVQFIIKTDKDNPGYTAVQNAQHQGIALIEWKSSPVLEIRNSMTKQPVKNWLKLSSDRSSRYMEVRGSKYVWATHNQSINLHAGDFARSFLANVSRTHTSIALQITSDALQQRLLESIVIAAVLLQSGRNID